MHSVIIQRPDIESKQQWHKGNLKWSSFCIIYAYILQTCLLCGGLLRRSVWKRSSLSELIRQVWPLRSPTTSAQQTPGNCFTQLLFPLPPSTRINFPIDFQPEGLQRGVRQEYRLSFPACLDTTEWELQNGLLSVIKWDVAHALGSLRSTQASAVLKIKRKSRSFGLKNIKEAISAISRSLLELSNNRGSALYIQFPGKGDDAHRPQALRKRFFFFSTKGID